MRTATPLLTWSRMTDRAVGDVGGDFHAAVEGAGVHDEGVIWQPRRAASRP